MRAIRHAICEGPIQAYGHAYRGLATGIKLPSGKDIVLIGEDLETTMEGFRQLAGFDPDVTRCSDVLIVNAGRSYRSRASDPIGKDISQLWPLSRWWQACGEDQCATKHWWGNQ